MDPSKWPESTQKLIGKWMNARLPSIKKGIARELLPYVADPLGDLINGGCVAKSFSDNLVNTKETRLLNEASNILNVAAAKVISEKLARNEISSKVINSMMNFWLEGLKRNNIPHTSKRSFDKHDFPKDSYVLEIKPFIYARWSGLDYGRASMFNPDKCDFSFDSYISDRQDARSDHIFFWSEKEELLTPPEDYKVLLTRYIHFQLHK
jgi:hypothetical protein